MESRYLIDTNVIIDLSANRFNEKSLDFLIPIIDNNPKISIINKIELLGFSNVTPEIIEFVESSTLLNINDSIVDLTIQIRKDHKIKLPDAIIASTCIAHDLTLLSNNDSDFKKIKTLKYLNPYTK